MRKNEIINDEIICIFLLDTMNKKKFFLKLTKYKIKININWNKKK